MKRIVFFDVDNVLIKGQTQKILVHFLFEKREISLFYFLKIYFWFLFYKLTFVRDTIKIRQEALKLFEDRDVLDIKKLFKDFFEQKIKQNIFNQSIKIIKEHINQDDEVILTSASLSEIVDELKRFLSLSFSIATKLEVANGKYTGKIVGDVSYGENKVKEVKDFLKNNGFCLEGSYAYADHYSDLPLLAIVSNPVVVNPDIRLRKVAKKKGWHIYDF